MLQRAITYAHSLGVTGSSVSAALLSRTHRSSNGGQDLVQRDFQREAYKQLLRVGPDRLDGKERLRKKIERWRVPLPPRVATDRIHALLFRLGPLVRPRVHAAVWRTLFNGWCTRRRFQQHGACLFQCNAHAADSIEHYVSCRFYMDLRSAALQLLPISDASRLQMVFHRTWSDDRLILEAVAMFSLYTTYNQIRTHGFVSAEVCADGLVQSCYNAVRNHGRSTTALSRARMRNGCIW